MLSARSGHVNRGYQDQRTSIYVSVLEGPSTVALPDGDCALQLLAIAKSPLASSVPVAYGEDSSAQSQMVQVKILTDKDMFP